jgi:hypothetical protein
MHVSRVHLHWCCMASLLAISMVCAYFLQFLHMLPPLVCVTQKPSQNPLPWDTASRVEQIDNISVSVSCWLIMRMEHLVHVCICVSVYQYTTVSCSYSYGLKGAARLGLGGVHDLATMTCRQCSSLTWPNQCWLHMVTTGTLALAASRALCLWSGVNCRACPTCKLWSITAYMKRFMCASVTTVP